MPQLCRTLIFSCQEKEIILFPLFIELIFAINSQNIYFRQ